MARKSFRNLYIVLIPLMAVGIWFGFWEWRRQQPTNEAKPAVASGPNIVLIVVDTLRADHMSLYGYERPTTPELERWFRDGWIFEAAYAPMSFTPPSMMSLFSGLYPMRHRVRMVFQKLPANVAVIPDYLKTRGYHTAAVVSNMVLTDEATALGPRFDYFDDYVDEPVQVRKSYERNAARTTDAAIAWLEKARFLESPHFLWLHYMDPHGPYTPAEDKPIAFSHDEPLPIDLKRVPVYNRLETNDGWDYVDRYDEEIAYTDREIGRFLEVYQKAGFLDEAIVIFTSDHGEYMMDHEKWFTHGYHVYQACTRIPLMIRKPNAEPGRPSTPVSLVDVAPTILEWAGMEPSTTFDGQSFTAPKPTDIFLEGLGTGRGKQYRALIRGNQKWVIYSENGVEDPSRRRYYDLASDPHELNPLSWQAAKPAPAALLEALRRDPDPSGLPGGVIAGARLKKPKIKPQEGLPVVVEGLDEETLERLRALGYIQ